ncbi:MAG: hypothetical protein M3O67_07825 [Bacteroidota bacterium]|nr:hypothetical protein [Bacteroidota bacterium]
MFNFTSKKKLSQNEIEKHHQKLLMEKMDISKKEILEINQKYGVSASKMIELMQYSKYQFVNKEKS